MVLVSVLVSVFVALAVPFLFFSKMDEEKARAPGIATPDERAAAALRYLSYFPEDAVPERFAGWERVAGFGFELQAAGGEGLDKPGGVNVWNDSFSDWIDR